VVLPAGNYDCIGCFTDQVKLTRVLVRGLDEVFKEVKLLGEHEEESSQKITKLAALCKRLREDVLKLKEEKATLEGMVESCDELIMEVTEDEEEDDDADDGGDATAPPATAPEEIIMDEDPVEMVPKQEAPVVHEVILADVEPEIP
jgi:hypothetical protein